MTIEYIAKNVHNANCVYCEAHGDFVDPEWNELSEERRQSRLAEGWVYGPVKDPEAKTHPCLVAYDQLPEAQRYKDKLFASNVARCEEEEEEA